MTKADLMELSDEGLALLAAQVRAEHERRHLGSTVVEVHAGNMDSAGKPIPQLVRVVTKVAQLAPGDVGKVETLINGLLAARPAVEPA
jgi:hypothetical protein